MPKTKKEQDEHLKVVLTIQEKDDKTTTVSIGYENTKNATDNEKRTGANVYNVCCEAVQKMKKLN